MITTPGPRVAALASDTPTDGQVPTWNTGGTVTWETLSGGSGLTACETTELSSTNLLNWHTTPITIVPAGGADTTIDLISIRIRLTYVSSYSGGGNVLVRYNNDSSAQFTMGSTISASFFAAPGNNQQFSIITGHPAVAAANIENEEITMSMGVALTGGTSTATVIACYRTSSF